MKAIILTLATLCLAANAYGLEYHLQCNQEDVRIRWPSYISNSDYYVCSSLGGKLVKMHCEPGEVFTFAYQMCTPTNQFILPPPLEYLPTSKPVGVKPIPTGGEKPPLLPQYPGSGSPLWPVPQFPPIFEPEHPAVEEPHVTHMPGKPFFPSAPNGGEQTVSDATSETPPLPPTPEPTPPVVQQPPKKPPTAPNKKPVPSAPVKKPATAPVKKPTPPQSPARKQPSKAPSTAPKKPTPPQSPARKQTAPKKPTKP